MVKKETDNNLWIEIQEWTLQRWSSTSMGVSFDLVRTGMLMRDPLDLACTLGVQANFPKILLFVHQTSHTCV